MDTPVTFFAGLDDSHVSNESTYALNLACPDSRVVMFQPSGDYDSHYCTWREDAAVEEFDLFFFKLLSINK